MQESGAISVTSKAEIERGVRYLRDFGELEKVLRQIARADVDVPLFTVLRDLRSRLPSIARWISVVEDLANLRNVVAHGTHRIGKMVPTVESLSELEACLALADGLTENLSRFFKTVVEFKLSQALSDALSYMHKHDFSQIAVRSGSVVGLLTAVDVTNWLASRVSDGIVSIEDSQIEDAFVSTAKGRFLVVARNATISDAAIAFAQAARGEYNNLYCVLITEHGKSSEKVLGIVTPWDLMHLPAFAATE